MSIFLFTGLSASGKSSISKEACNTLNIPRVDIHNIISKEAVRRGYCRGRDWIFSIGTENALLHTRKVVISELRKVLLKREGIAVVDEILETKTLDAIKTAFPEHSVKIIYIRANRHDRVKFVQKRISAETKKEAKKEIGFIDLHKQRTGIREIIELSDYKVRNIGTLEDAVDEVVGIIKTEINKTIEGQDRDKERLG